MIQFHPSESRGYRRISWLESWHSFSFGHYYNPKQMSFGSLRVINEDIVDPGQGFATHPHRDMEIVTFILSGQLEHKDSMGNGSVIHRAEVQRMSAGTGVTHSEFNPSKTEKTHLLQIWFLPEAEGLPPGYEQKAFDMEQAKDSLLLVASRKGLQGSVHLNQSVKMYLTRPQNQPVSYTPEMGRGVWVHLATGQGKANNQPMKAGDAVAVTQEESVELTGDADSLFVLFDVEISGR